MASHDSIEPKAPAYSEFAPGDLKEQKSSSTENGFPDDKEGSGAVAHYGVDPEKQSSHVGSLRGEESVQQRGPIYRAFIAHWKIAAQVVLFKVMTASVSRASNSRWRCLRLTSE
jgi:hypothetical protein